MSRYLLFCYDPYEASNGPESDVIGAWECRPSDSEILDVLKKEKYTYECIELFDVHTLYTVAYYEFSKGKIKKIRDGKS